MRRAQDRTIRRAQPKRRRADCGLALAWASMFSTGGQQATALVGLDTLRWALWLGPAMLVGIWVGNRAFQGVSPEHFRRRVINLLIAIALLSVMRALVR